MDGNSSIQGKYLDIYTRVSSDVQLEGESIQIQKSEGKKISEKLNLIPRYHNEGSKSSKFDDLKNRPILSKLLTKVDDGEVSDLFVYNTDRLSRNQVTWGLIRFKLFSKKVQLHTPTQTINLDNLTDNLMLGILKEISVYDNHLRSERSRVGKMERVKLGYWKGGLPPFGFSVVDKKLIENKVESRLVVKMFEMIRDNKSTLEIQDMMNKSGFDTRHKKGLWNTQTIRKMLQNSVYIGWYTFKDKKSGEVIRGTNQRIIDNVLFDEVQSHFDKYRNRKNQDNSTRHFYLLRHLLKCECGGSYGGLTRLTSGSVSKKYYCNVRNKDKNLCNNKMSLNKPLTDKLVWESIKEVVRSSYTLMEEYKVNLVKGIQKSRNFKDKKDVNFGTIKKRYLREISRVEESITTLEGDIRLNKVIGDSTKIKGRLMDEKERLENELKNKEEEFKEINVESKWINWMEKFDSELMEKEKLKDKEKKDFIDGLVSSIDVSFNEEKLNHTLIINFKLPIVEDNRVKVGNNKFEIIDGKNRLIKSDLLLNYHQKKT